MEFKGPATSHDSSNKRGYDEGCLVVWRTQNKKAKLNKYQGVVYLDLRTSTFKKSMPPLGVKLVEEEWKQFAEHKDYITKCFEEFEMNNSPQKLKE